MEKTLEVARDRLRKGMQVVVAMMGTGEAASARAVKSRGRATAAAATTTTTTSPSASPTRRPGHAAGLLKKAEEHHNEDTQEEWTPRDHQEDVRHLIQPWNPDPEAWLGKYVLLSTMMDRSMLDCFEGAVAQVTKVVNKTFVYVSILPDLARNAGIGEAFTSGRKKVELRLRELRELSALPSNDTLRRSMGFELHVLRRRAVCLTLPPVSPLDALHNGLGGADAVAELTGRSNILKEDAERGGWISVPRDQPPERDLEDFQMGRKKAAVLSGAMSTGISMHADGVGAPRRCMILFELPWSAEKAMQQIGRVHRSRQESAPEYVLMASNRGFEQRFSSTVGSRLAQLGAIASGDRETLTTSSQLRLRATAASIRRILSRRALRGGSSSSRSRPIIRSLSRWASTISTSSRRRSS